MASKQLKKALSESRFDINESGRNLGVLGVASPIREELEKNAENLAVREIPIDTLEDNPFQYLARSEINPEGLAELAESIKTNGFYGALLARQSPNNPNKFQLAYGHRRKAAAKLAGLTTLPVKVMNLDNQQMARVMASENFSREDLTVIGEVNVIGHLYDTENLSAEQIAEIIGKGRTWVANRLLVHLGGPDLKRLITEKPDSLVHIKLLNQVKDVKLRKELIQDILNQNLTHTQLEAIIRVKNPKQRKERISDLPSNSKGLSTYSNENSVTDFLPDNFGQLTPIQQLPELPIGNDEAQYNYSNDKALEEKNVTNFTDFASDEFREINNNVGEGFTKQNGSAARAKKSVVNSNIGQGLYSQGLVQLQRNTDVLLEIKRKNPVVQLSDTEFAVLQKVIEELTGLLSDNHE